MDGVELLVQQPTLVEKLENQDDEELEHDSIELGIQREFVFLDSIYH